MELLQSFKHLRSLGSISCLCLDPAGLWLLAGTANGHLCLWDLRFGLLLRSWRVSPPTNQGESSATIYRCVVHPSRGKGRWVIVAAEFSEQNVDNSKTLLQVWDIDRGALVESFAVKSSGMSITPPLERTVEDERLSAGEAIENFLAQEGLSPQSPSTPTANYPNTAISPISVPLPPASVRAVLTGLDYGDTRHQRSTSFGAPTNRRQQIEPTVNSSAKPSLAYVLTAGEDRKVRFWDLDNSESSGIVSGLEIDTEKPSYT